MHMFYVKKYVQKCYTWCFKNLFVYAWFFWQEEKFHLNQAWEGLQIPQTVLWNFFVEFCFPQIRIIQLWNFISNSAKKSTIQKIPPIWGILFPQNKIVEFAKSLNRFHFVEILCCANNWKLNSTPYEEILSSRRNLFKCRLWSGCWEVNTWQHGTFAMIVCLPPWIFLGNTRIFWEPSKCALTMKNILTVR